MLRWWLSLFLCVCALAARAGELDEALSAYRAGAVAQALPSLRRLAAQGLPAAQYTLGQIMQRGRDVEQDTRLALNLFEQAAAAGYVPAQLALGELYESGTGVPADRAQAARWYEKAAAGGDAPARLQLASYYIRLNTPEGFQQALPPLQAAAAQGLADAQYFLGRLYLEGKGVDGDRAQAMLWLGRAGAQGHIAAQRFLYLLKQAETPDTALALRELRRNLAAGEAQLDAQASEPRYGYEPRLAIKTGLGFDAEWRYLNALRGPHGEAVHYLRLGHCCAFDSTRAEGGKGFLDRYQLQYEGQAQAVLLYLNMFDEGPLQAPWGFSFAPKRDE